MLFDYINTKTILYLRHTRACTLIIKYIGAITYFDIFYGIGGVQYPKCAYGTLGPYQFVNSIRFWNGVSIVVQVEVFLYCNWNCIQKENACSYANTVSISSIFCFKECIFYNRMCVYWCFTSHATIFQLYMWRHRCAGGLKKLYLRSGSQRQSHFVGFFIVTV